MFFPYFDLVWVSLGRVSGLILSQLIQALATKLPPEDWNFLFIFHFDLV
jgi:hypothetical protein